MSLSFLCSLLFGSLLCDAFPLEYQLLCPGVDCFIKVVYKLHWHSLSCSLLVFDQVALRGRIELINLTHKQIDFQYFC